MKREWAASPAGLVLWPYPSSLASNGNGSSAYPGPLLQKNKQQKKKCQNQMHACILSYIRREAL